MLRIITALFAVAGTLFLTSTALYFVSAAPRHRAHVELGCADLPVLTGWTAGIETAIPDEGAADAKPLESHEVISLNSGSEHEELGDLPTLLPGERPSWTVQPDDFGSDTHRLMVVTLPCNDVEKCREELKRLVVGKIERYAQQQLGLSEPIATHINDWWIERNLLDNADEYVASADVDGEMLYQIWAGVSVTPHARAEMRAWQYASEWNADSLRVAAGALAALSCVGLLHLIFSARASRAGRKTGSN